jgi:Tol biopolymer transport system component
MLQITAVQSKLTTLNNVVKKGIEPMKKFMLITAILVLFLQTAYTVSLPSPTPTDDGAAIGTATVSAIPTGEPPLVLATQSVKNSTGTISAPVILLMTDQKGSLGDIYTWNIASQSLKQLTSWGYNSAPRVSPDGNWLVYRSMSRAAVSAMTQGLAMNVYKYANIWLLNPYTEEAIRIADQPQNATFTGGGLISRLEPVWSPDGTSVAWIENDVHGERVSIYTLSSKSTTTFPINLPPGCCEGAAPTLYVGRSGIAITNQEGTPVSSHEVIYVFDTSGQQLAKVDSGEKFHVYFGWIADGNSHEYLGGEANGLFTLADPSGNTQLTTPQSYPEMYNPKAPDGLSANPVKYPNQWALTLHGQKLAEITDIRTASDVSIAPDGQGIVYQQMVESADVPDGKVFAYLVNGQTIQITPTLHILAVTWGATAWRIHN